MATSEEKMEEGEVEEEEEKEEGEAQEKGMVGKVRREHCKSVHDEEKRG